MELYEYEDDSKVTPRTMLGRRLRRMRECSGLSLRALAEQVGYPHTYIGRAERGEQLPSEALATALDSHFGTNGLFSDLLEMAQDTLIPEYSRKAVSREPEAERIQVFTSSLIPGLLQTEGYAYELFRRSLPGKAEDELRGYVSLRLDRQQILSRKEPPFYWAIIDEAALKRPVGDAKCMIAQIYHLLSVAQEPHITMQVVPFSEGAHPMLGGCLTLLALPNGTSTAFVESFASGELVESTKRVVELTQRFDMARSMPFPEEKSMELIRKYLEEYEDEDNS